MSLYDKIPNNVNLSNDKRLVRALEHWLPNYMRWWQEMGPAGFQADRVYLRTAVSVEPGGWAHFDYVRMPEYRWGIFLAPPEKDRRIGFGDHYGQPVWQEVPGEYRNMLRRIIVTQGDTEPASVEQQRLLGRTTPSLYDLRNLFQVNVEEGRHLWAMVYLLHSYFGREGREETEELLERRSGDADKPRILGAFNEPIHDWLAFYMFTTFTDRDGKYQLLALAESGFDPLSRTTRFMLTEEAHHMFVGQSGVDRVVKRACEIMRETGDDDVRRQGAIDLETVQRYINLWYSVSLDLFGGEISSNAANFFAAGLKGRYKEETFSDHLALEGSYRILEAGPNGWEQKEVPLRNAMNEVLRDAYIADCESALARWNRTIAGFGIPYRLRLPDRRFHRRIGVYSAGRFDPQGRPMTAEQWESRRHEFLPSEKDLAYVRNLMTPTLEAGKIAHWISKPTHGIHGLPFEFEYVRREP
ncbi:MAG TPA: benzoyl-CoA 2,3-epoxidase subunit BoxB [Bryobacterales bacterium]|nr:benzoyl-CoA 2,3-epoxidase subunit BoxB [Bryobacterales bacterium]